MWARTGTPWLLLSGLATLASFLAFVALRALWATLPLSASLSLLLLCLFFFRDPERVPGPGVVAAADGRVLSVSPEGDRVRVATFMNVTNVHVNRVPYDGTLLGIEDRGGPKRPAFSPQALGNSQKRYRFETSIGPLEVVQITGMVARRCISWVRPGPVHKGDRLGMIAFGSRVDVVLPAARVHVLVHVGQPVRAGNDTLAEVLP